MMLAELKAKFEAASLVAAGYSVFRDTLPDAPDKAIALYETGGSGAEIAFGGAVVEHPTVQIVARGAANDRQTPLAAIQTIYQGVLALGAFTQGTTRYLNIEPLQPPFPIDRDATNRIKFAFNVRIDKQLTAVT